MYPSSSYLTADLHEKSTRFNFLPTWKRTSYLKVFYTRQ